MDKIKHNIKIKGNKKKMREDNFKKVDWQMKRLPSLARALNGIFVSEKKQVIKLETLLNKLNYSDRLESDIQRLIESSNGWLSNQRRWVRKKQEDINNVCKQLM